MSIQKININGADVEIEDVSARTSISNLTSEVNTVKGAINEVKQSIGESGGGMSATYNSSTNTLTIA